MNPIEADLEQGTNKKSSQDFDFITIACSCLRGKADYTGFLPYHDTYQTLGQRYCFDKETSKKLLASLSRHGLLIKKKRGIRLVI